jgi:hypothetical protein
MITGNNFMQLNNVFDRHVEINVQANSRYLTHGALSRPIMLICETVNVCNNSCVICAESLMTRDRTVMPLHLFKRVLDNYIAMGGGCLSLTPVIGDIFMDSLLLERIKLLEQYRERGIQSLSVTTNAVMAHKYRSNNLQYVVNSFDRFHISIYGRDGTEHFALTRRDTFDAMIRSVREITNLANDSGRIRVGFRLLGGYSDEELSEWIMKYFGKPIPFQAINTYANWGNIDITGSNAAPDMWHPVVNNTTQCLIPLLAMQVFSNGNVSFCACSDYNADIELSLGNIMDADLLTLYNTDKARQLWDFEKRMPAFCRRCSFHRPIDQLGEFMWVFDRPLDFIGG